MNMYECYALFHLYWLRRAVNEKRTVLPAPHGKGNKCDFKRATRIIRYRTTATLRRLQIKQYTA